MLCILQGCVLWRNWWPMLTGLMYVLVPMPYLFFGSAGDSYGYGSMASGCAGCRVFAAVAGCWVVSLPFHCCNHVGAAGAVTNKS
jgi:hypothetical protein